MSNSFHTFHVEEKDYTANRATFMAFLSPFFGEVAAPCDHLVAVVAVVACRAESFYSLLIL